MSLHHHMKSGFVACFTNILDRGSLAYPQSKVYKKISQWTRFKLHCCTHLVIQLLTKFNEGLSQPCSFNFVITWSYKQFRQINQLSPIYPAIKGILTHFRPWGDLHGVEEIPMLFKSRPPRKFSLWRISTSRRVQVVIK